MQRHLQPGTRLYSFGAGSSVNRFLLNRIAELGRGIARVIRHDEPVNEVVEKFFCQINNPVLANINLQWEGDGASPVMYPSTPPDLFAEQPLVLFGRKPDSRSGKLHISGIAAGGTRYQAGKLHISGIAAGGTRYQQTFNLNFEKTGNPAIAQLWGRSRIKDLMNQMVSGETKVGVEAVTDTALTYQLLSQYTAFVAVSDDVRVNPTEGSVSVQVPVEMPEGISYQGIFGSAASTMMSIRYDDEVPTFLQPRRSPRREAPMSPPPPMAAMPSFEEIESSTGERKRAKKEAYRPFPGVGSGSGPGVGSGSGIPSAPRDAELEDLKAKLSEIAPVCRPQIVSVSGLDQQMVALLTQHLQSIQFPTIFNGDLVFELQVSKGRVRQVVLDEQLSSLKEETVIETIRRSLLTWLAPQTLTTTVILTMRIQP